MPEHLFNMLANYKTRWGGGVQFNIQVTGPVDTTTSGQLDLVDSSFVPDAIVANGGYYKSPRIPWQYTANLAVFYLYRGYEFKVTAYNLTDRHNLTNDYPFFGNDFITRDTPLSVAFSVKAKFR